MNLITQIGTIVVIVGAVLWWTNKKAEDRFDELVIEFQQKQIELETRLRSDFKQTTDSLLKDLQEDRERTERLIDEFRNQDGSSDPSGIDGRFLRDSN